VIIRHFYQPFLHVSTNTTFLSHRSLRRSVSVVLRLLYGITLIFISLGLKRSKFFFTRAPQLLGVFREGANDARLLGFPLELTFSRFFPCQKLVRQYSLGAHANFSRILMSANHFCVVSCVRKGARRSRILEKKAARALFSFQLYNPQKSDFSFPKKTPPGLGAPQAVIQV